MPFDNYQCKPSKKRVLKAGKGSLCPELSIALDMNVSKVTRYNSIFEIFDNYQCKPSKKLVLMAGKCSICPELSIALDMNVSKVTRYNSMFEIFDNNESYTTEKTGIEGCEGQYMP